MLKLQALRTECEHRLDERGVALHRRVGDDEHLLKKRADDADRDLRTVIDAENGGGELLLYERKIRQAWTFQRKDDERAIRRL